MIDILNEEILNDIFSYMNEYEIIDILIGISEWDSKLEWMERFILQNRIENNKLKECKCDQIINPSMNHIIQIIESDRYELLDFYRRVFNKHNKYEEFLFSWIILFGSESFIQIFIDKNKLQTNFLWSHYAHSTHIIYGLELISFKMRNKIPIHDFYQIIHQIGRYCHNNKDIMFIYKNYNQFPRKFPLVMRLYQDIEEKYRSLILSNPSFAFLYIETDETDL